MKKKIYIHVSHHKPASLVVYPVGSRPCWFFLVNNINDTITIEKIATAKRGSQRNALLTSVAANWLFIPELGPPPPFSWPVGGLIFDLGFLLIYIVCTLPMALFSLYSTVDVFWAVSFDVRFLVFFFFDFSCLYGTLS